MGRCECVCVCLYKLFYLLFSIYYVVSLKYLTKVKKNCMNHKTYIEVDYV